MNDDTDGKIQMTTDLPDGSQVYLRSSAKNL